MRLQRSSRNWRIECRILCTRAFSFLPVARIVAKVAAPRAPPRNSREVQLRCATKPCFSFVPRTRKRIRRRASFHELENLIFNHQLTNRSRRNPIPPDALSPSGFRCQGPGLESSLLTASASYAAQARAKARACSPGKVPWADVTSSRVCLPPSSSINESSHCASGGLIVTVRRSRKSVIRNWPYWRPSC
jgi:hypothetical protein